VQAVQLTAPSPAEPQTALTYGGNGKGRTISFMKHPMNCADTQRKTLTLSAAISHAAHPSPKQKLEINT